MCVYVRNMCKMHYICITYIRMSMYVRVLCMCVCVFDTHTKDADAQTHAHTHKNTGAYIAGAFSFFCFTRSNNEVPYISGAYIYTHVYSSFFSFFSCTPSRYTYRPTKRSHACKMTHFFFLSITRTQKKFTTFLWKCTCPDIRNFANSVCSYQYMRPLLRHKDRVLPHFLPKKKYKNWKKEGGKKRDTSTAPKLTSQAQRHGVERVHGKCVCTRGICVGGVRVRVQEGKGASVVKKKMEKNSGTRFARSCS